MYSLLGFVHALSLVDAYIKQFAKPLQQALQEAGTVSGVSQSALPFFASVAFKQSQGFMVIVCSSNRQAQHFLDETNIFIGKKQCLLFPGYENIPYGEGGISPEVLTQRVYCLDQILRPNQPKLIFTTADAMLRKLPQPERFYEQAINIKANQQYPPQQLLRDIISLGYRRVERIEVPGEVCVKGSIIDLYPVNLKIPIRLDYFDDIIENLSPFDIENQRSQDPLHTANIHILPSSEVLLHTKESQALCQKLRTEKQAGKKKLPLWVNTLSIGDQGGSLSEPSILAQLHYPGVESLFPLVSKTASFLDYFRHASLSPLVLLYPGLEIHESFSRIHREFETLYNEKKTDQFCLPPEQLLCDFSSSDTFIEVHPYGNTSLGLSDTSSIRGKLNEVRQKITDLIQDNHQVILSSSQSAQIRRIADFFTGEKNIQTKICKSLVDLEVDIEQEGHKQKPKTPSKLPAKSKKNKDPIKTLHLLHSLQSQGFCIPELKFYLLTDAELFGRAYQRRSRAKSAKSVSIDSFVDLKAGDTVVHLTHGIGRFIGMEKVKTMGLEKDFLLLEYADKDRLYVPLDQISIVQKYLAPTENPRLDSLGKASFKKKKAKVQEHIEKLAQELLRLQAVRVSRKGHQFPVDTKWQEEFEGLFPYNETPDQLSAIEAVKQDMESSQPMDRLICGDVGYGKTEVAIRAIFKAVLSGKQAALITPTTILALQHYQTLKQRFHAYPIRVDWISRFRTSQEITKIKKALATGELDAIVGTHALLSPNLPIKNLGLLIIDEEQRFGVTHKEAIKRFRHLVDIITLTATPIPRTLHMSLVGIRDLSTIETPPQERLPVQTYVMENRDSIIREAIMREKERGGQIFYLHNRIASIEVAATRIMQLTPEINIGILHSRLREEEIEDTLIRFQEQKFDLLVTTSIIENGIDITNANTLIVDRSDHFGLSQLYQIRGRVGRGTKQAYAYFLYPPNIAMTEVAQKRLNTLLEYQDLGSSFKVAMRDLEIRGAGNVLGIEQSGHIIDVGYELYIKLLNQAVQELKGEKIQTQANCSLQLNTDFYIPEEYIPDLRQRIEFYKRFEAAREEHEITSLTSEMEDRFGPLDEVTKTFSQVEHIRILGQMAGFSSVQRSGKNKVEFHIGEHFRLTPQSIVLHIQKNPGLSIKANQQGSLFYQIERPEDFTNELIELLRSLLSKTEISQTQATQKFTTKADSQIATYK